MTATAMPKIQVLSTWQIVDEVHRSERRRAVKLLSRRSAASKKLPKVAPPVAAPAPPQVAPPKRRREPWTPHEEEFALGYVSVRGYTWVAKQLGRSLSAVHHHLQYEMAKRDVVIVRLRLWSDREIRRLRHLWDEPCTLTAIAKELRRTEMAVYRKALELRLTSNAPDGYEYIKPAAAKCGYHPTSFLKIMRWAKVKVYVARTPPGPRERSQVREMVDLDAAEQACWRWGQTEPVNVAAERIGVYRDGLVKALMLIGKLPPGKGRVWRVSQAEVAEAMKAWRPNFAVSG